MDAGDRPMKYHTERARSALMDWQKAVAMRRKSDETDGFGLPSDESLSLLRKRYLLLSHLAGSKTDGVGQL